jgi:hypothetical protein
MDNRMNKSKEWQGNIRERREGDNGVKECKNRAKGTVLM